MTDIIDVQRGPDPMQEDQIQEDTPVLGPTPLPDAMQGDVVENTIEEPNDPDDPETNTYSLKKAEIEKECCKVLIPFMYLYLPLDAPKGTEPIQNSAAKIRDLYQNKYYFEKNEKGDWVKHKFVHRWMDDPHIREYAGIVVDPLCTNPRYYNMWRPYKASLLPPVPPESVMDLIKKIIDHINVVYTNFNLEHTNYILDYMCNIIQRPTKKTNVLLNFQGKEGSGKGMLWVFLRLYVLGEYCTAQTDDPENHIFGRFGNMAFNNVLIQIDEVKTKFRECADSLKNLVTNGTINYEKKGKDTITVQNLTNVVLTTNNQYVLKITANDRRYVVFECNPVYINDSAYKVSFGNYLERPDVARAFYQFAMERDLSRYVYDFQAFRPKTEVYRENQKMAIPAVSRFLSALVNTDFPESHAEDSGKVFVMKAGKLDATSKMMYKKFMDFQVAGNNKTAYSDVWFFNGLKKFKGITNHRTKAFRYYKLDLAELRAFLIDTNEYDEDAGLD
jgi:hypothetical protein